MQSDEDFEAEMAGLTLQEITAQRVALEQKIQTLLDGIDPDVVDRGLAMFRLHVKGDRGDDWCNSAPLGELYAWHEASGCDWTLSKSAELRQRSTES